MAKVKQTIAASTGASSSSLDTSSVGRARAMRIEAAMRQAIIACSEEGITDPVQVRERMMAAREKHRAA